MTLEKPFYATVNPLVERLIRAGVRPNTITTVGRAWCSSPPSHTPPVTSGSAVQLLLLSGVADTLDGQVARGGAMVTKFGAFYDSTLDRVGDGATFIGIGAFLMTAPDVAFRTPAVIVCMVAILSSLLVSYARARAEGLGLDCKVGIAQRAERILGLGLASVVFGAGPPRAPARGDRRAAGHRLGDHGGAAVRVCPPARRPRRSTPPGGRHQAVRRR